MICLLSLICVVLSNSWCVVCLQVSSFPSSLQLLSIMQALLLLGPERADIWQALEALANRAILIAQSCEFLSLQCISVCFS